MIRRGSGAERGDERGGAEEPEEVDDRGAIEDEDGPEDHDPAVAKLAHRSAGGNAPSHAPPQASATGERDRRPAA